MDRFFNRSPYEVGNDLRGMTLRVGEQEAVIQKTLPQFRHENEQWQDRPLFSEGVEAYVAPFRDSHLLFLRTGPDGANTCVRIDAANMGERKLIRPGQVCKELGLVGEQVGTVALQEDVVSIEWISGAQEKR